MTEPITWQIMLAIKAMIEAISIDNGFHTDMGSFAIFTDRSQQNPERNGPFVVILAGEITPNDGATGNKTAVSDMAFVVEYAIPAGNENPELIAHRGRADLVRALRNELRGQLAGFRNIQISSSQFTSAVVPGTQLVIAQVSARAGLSESLLPA